MAEKTKSAPKGQSASKNNSQKIPAEKTPQKNKTSPFKFILVLFLLVSILGAGFAAGIYLNLIDLQKINQTYKLYEYPVLSKYFPKPQTNFETVAIEDQPTDNQVSNLTTQAASPAAPQPTVVEKVEPPKVDLEREIKARQLEEQKKISKLARLYGAMKPDEAVSIMKELDDETVLAILSRMEEEQVSKILALFDAKKAASLTREMLKSKPALPGKV